MVLLERIGLTSIGTAMYLTTSSNGTIDGFKSYVKEKLGKLVTAYKKLRTPAPVPETGLNEPVPSLTF